MKTMRMIAAITLFAMTLTLGGCFQGTVRQADPEPRYDSSRPTSTVADTRSAEDIKRDNANLRAQLVQLERDHSDLLTKVDALDRQKKDLNRQRDEMKKDRDRWKKAAK